MRDENVRLNDLVNDDRFIRWVKEPDDDLRAYWEEWLAANPDKQEMVEMGQQMVSFFHFETPVPPAGDFQEVRDKIKAQIREEEAMQTEAPGKTPPEAEERGGHFSRYYQMAAVWIGILLVALGTFLYFQTRHEVTYYTGFGETRTVWLPDQSQATLNANSSVRFYRNWSGTKPREVWLAGEAFFDVRPPSRPDSPAGTFTVHADSVQVRAQGTQFNVYNRRNMVKVVMSEGEVNLSLAGVRRHPLRLRPGDMAEVSTRDRKVNQRQVKPGTYTMWRSHKLVFEETTLRELAQTLQDYYGVNVQFTSPELAERRFTGEVPAHDLQGLLTVLTESFNIRITRNSDQIIIQNKD
jgi:ferric-dicitrate binding protein FerR (iron transport regulator)